MKKLTIAILMLFSSFSIASAELGLKVGVSAQLGEWTATGNESEGAAAEISADEKETMLVPIGEWFIEKNLSFLPGPFSRVSLGYSQIAHDLGSATSDQHQQDVKGDDQSNVAADTDGLDTIGGEQKIQADFEDLETMYVLVNITDWLYVKGGSTSMDIKTNENLYTGGLYPNASVDGTVYEIGTEFTTDGGMFMRLSVNEMDFDNVKNNENFILSNSISIFPFAGYGRSKNRNPDKKWWDNLVNKFVENKIHVYHFGYITEPSLSSDKKFYHKLTNLDFFYQIRIALGSKMSIGVDSGSMWAMAAYSHPTIVLLTNWFKGHKENFYATNPINLNGDSIFTEGGFSKLSEEDVFEKCLKKGVKKIDHTDKFFSFFR